MHNSKACGNHINKEINATKMQKEQLREEQLALWRVISAKIFYGFAHVLLL